MSLCVIFRFFLATLDIKSAYLQAGPMPRTIYVRTPKGWSTSRHILWKLLKPAYGIVESGRLWQLQVEAWMAGEGINHVIGLPQLFIKYGESGLPILIIAKVVDDMLIAGRKEEIKKFHDSISRRFKVGRFLTEGTLVFNRLYIKQRPDRSIVASMQEYLDTIKPLEISRSRRKEQKEKCTEAEVKAFLGLTGALNYLGLGIIPQAAYVASHLQQSVSRLTVAHLCIANKCLAEIKSMTPELFYEAPIEFHNPSYLAFSDASQGKTSYGQTGYVSGIYIPSKQDSASVFHMIDWLSQKQGRVSFSAIGAEIIAACLLYTSPSPRDLSTSRMPSSA